jgi:DNA-binding transcriptional regulator YhcF (GntR family)
MKIKYETAGPLSSVFSSPEARVLDQAFLVGNMKQTIPMLAESTGLSFKTVQKVLQRLSAKGFVAPTAKIGNAQAYQFRVENELHELIEWASKYHFASKD